MNQVKNKRGKWVPAMPLPLYTSYLFLVPTYQCECGHKSLTKKDYRGHYALVHVLEME